MTWSKKRLIVISAVGLSLIGVAVFYVQYYILRPVGNGPAGPHVATESFAKPWTERPVQVVGIGDSITAGLGADSPEHTFFQRMLTNPEDEYAEMQGKSLSAVLPNLQSENLAVSGSTSKDHLATIESRLPEYDAEVFGIVVMTTGGNDLIHSYGRAAPRECAMYGATQEEAEPWIEAYRQRLSEMLDKIEAKFPGGCEIYLADIYDPTRWRRRRTECVLTRLARCACYSWPIQRRNPRRHRKAGQRALGSPPRDVPGAWFALPPILACDV